MKTEKKLTDKQKLQQLLQFYHTNIANFAEKINVEKAYLYNISCDRVVRFNKDIQDAIRKNCPEISPAWLISGEGAMTNTAANVVANNSDNTAATISVGNTTTDSDRLLSLTESQQNTIDKQADTINRQSAIIGDLTASVCELAAKLAKLLPVLAVVALMGGTLAMSGCKKEVKCEWESVQLKGEEDNFGGLGGTSPFPSTYWQRYVCDGVLKGEIDFISGDTIYY